MIYVLSVNIRHHAGFLQFVVLSNDFTMGESMEEKYCCYPYEVHDVDFLLLLIRIEAARPKVGVEWVTLEGVQATIYLGNV